MSKGTTEGRTIVRDQWKDQRMVYTSGKVDYKGASTKHKASTSANELWYVWKYTWVGNDCTRIEGPLEGNWDDRASLGWAA